jgi:hypothetical protein
MCARIYGETDSMTVIEIRPHRWGWKAFEAPGVEPGSQRKIRQSIMCRTAPAFAQVKFGFSIQRETLSASFRSTTRIASYDAAILPLPAGPLTQLEMFQKRLKVRGKTLGHTPSLGVFCWLEVIDFDPFFGFLFLVLHVCYLSFAGLFMVCSSLQE